MCFDKQSSFLAWSLSCSIAVYLFNRNKGFDRWNAGFIIAFASIQLVEAGIWLSLEENSETSTCLNSILTQLIILILLFQPFYQSYMGYKYTQSEVLKFLSIIFSIIIVWTLFRLNKTPLDSFTSKPGEKGHLVWEDKSSPNNLLGNPLITVLYFIGMFLPLCYMSYHGGSGGILLAIGIITAIYSLLLAGPKEFGSFWCFSAVAYSMAALFV